MTQKDRVLKYIADFGSITALEAMSDLGIINLSGRISELVQEGKPIKKVSEKVKNRYGESCYVTRYSLGEKDKGGNTAKTQEEWEIAKQNLDFYIKEYASIPTGIFGLIYLRQLEARYNKGERSDELWRDMINAE